MGLSFCRGRLWLAGYERGLDRARQDLGHAQGRAVYLEVYRRAQLAYLRPLTP